VRVKHIRSSLVPVASVLGLVLVACGGTSPSAGQGGAQVSIPPGGAQTIAVSLGETGPGQMYMNLNQPAVAAGPVTFVVTNEGDKEHEFIVLQTDTSAGDFPVMSQNEAMQMEGGGMGHMHDFDEEAPGIVAVDEIEDLAAGATDRLEVNLKPGHYALVCNLRGHYTGGMWADFQVT